MKKMIIGLVMLTLAALLPAARAHAAEPEILMEEPVLQQEVTDEPMGDKFTFIMTDSGINWEFTVEGTECTLTGSKIVIPENAKNYHIPEIAENINDHKQYKVTAIGPFATTRYQGQVLDDQFTANSGFNGTVTIPSTVTKIAYSAFAGRTGFKGQLALPEGLKTIEHHAFDGCTGFTGDLIIPNSVTTMDYQAFSSCGFDGSLKLPSGLTKIEVRTFGDCNRFTGELFIPMGVTEIAGSAFINCTGFDRMLTLPDGLTTIGAEAFSNCCGLTGGLTLPASVRTIGTSAFFNCCKLTGNLVVPEGVTIIEPCAFQACIGLDGTLTLPSTVTEIGDYSFTGCSFKGNITLPNGLRAIGVSAFSGLTGLTGSLIVPDSVLIIADSAFSGCTGFNGTLTLGRGLTVIADGAFSGCSNFTGDLVIYGSENIAAGEELPGTRICDRAFESCKGFSSVTISDGVTYIGTSAFENCTGFVGGLTIPDSVSTLGSNSFKNCTGYSGKLYLGRIVTFGHGAFCDCKFTTIENPGNVAFYPVSYKPADSESTFYDILNADLVERGYYYVNDATGAKAEIIEGDFTNEASTGKYTLMLDGKKVEPESEELIKVRAFVTRMYAIMLGRAGEEAGIDDWTDKLMKKEMTGAGVAEGFVMSDELKGQDISDEEFVLRLYRTFFNSDGDEEGRAYWLGELKKGHSRKFVFRGFAESAQFSELCGNYGIERGKVNLSEKDQECSDDNLHIDRAKVEQYVDRLFMTILGRAGDPAGRQYWIDRIMKREESAASVAMRGFFHSEEYKNANKSDTEFSKDCYRSMMGREADANGLAYWEEQLNTGAYTRDSMIEIGFGNSKEFKEILQTYGLKKLD